VRHKWAAQRVGALLGDAHAAPPLAPLLDVADTLSLGIALVLPGGAPLAGAGGWGAAGADGAAALWGSVAGGARPPPPERELLPPPDVLQPSVVAAGAGDAPRPAALASPQVWDAGARAWVPAHTPAGRRAAAAEAASAAGTAPAAAAAAAAAGSVSDGARAAEGLATSRLPTLRSQAELQAHQAAALAAAKAGAPDGKAAAGAAGAAGAGSPFAALAAQTGDGAGETALALYGRRDHALTVRDRR